MKIRRDSGFSMVEVMVAAGLMGAVALGVAKLTKDQVKSVKTVETKFEFTTIINEIRQTLGNNESCKASFLNMDATNTPDGIITKIIKDTPGGPVDKYVADATGNGASYGNGAVKLLGYRLSVVDTDPSIGIVAGTNQGMTNLVVVFGTGAPGRTYTSNIVEKKIRLSVQTVSNTDFRITDCSASGTTDADYVNVVGDTMTGDLIMGDPTIPQDANIIMQGDSEIIFNSDKDLKHDIKSLGSVMSKIRKLNPVSYKWNTNDAFAYGLIAQELEPIFPTLVRRVDSGYLTVNYVQLTPILIQGIQELDAENRHLKTELKNMNQMMLEMRKEINQMKNKR